MALKTGEINKIPALHTQHQGFSNSFLVGHCPADFTSNPDQTHLPLSF